MTDTPTTALVVDDDPAFIQIARLMLTHAGCRVEAVSSGEACLEALGRVLPDVVLLDLDMPGLDGLETLGRIKATHPLLPVVMLTANTATESVVAAMNAGAYDYVVKPVDRTRIDTVVKIGRAHV